MSGARLGPQLERLQLVCSSNITPLLTAAQSKTFVESTCPPKHVSTFRSQTTTLHYTRQPAASATKSLAEPEATSAYAHAVRAPQVAPPCITMDFGDPNDGTGDRPPRQLPADLPKSLDDRKSRPVDLVQETEMYDGWQGMSRARVPGLDGCPRDMPPFLPMLPASQLPPFTGS
jgi:hypothetical protein